MYSSGKIQVRPVKAMINYNPAVCQSYFAVGFGISTSFFSTRIACASGSMREPNSLA